jgi:hypothetical protein
MSGRHGAAATGIWFGLDELTDYRIAVPVTDGHAVAAGRCPSTNVVSLLTSKMVCSKNMPRRRAEMSSVVAAVLAIEPRNAVTDLLACEKSL